MIRNTQPKNFVLPYYINSTDYFHIQKVDKPFEAKKPHTHEYFQIYYVIKGRLIHYVENDSSVLVRGDMFIVPPRVVHYIKPEASTVFYSFSFMPDFIGEINKNNRLAKNFLNTLLEHDNGVIRPKISVDKDVLYVETLLEQTLREFNEKSLGFGEVISSYAVILITMLARNYFESNLEENQTYFENNKQLVLHCIEYLEENFNQNVLLKDICKRFTLSKSNFCKLFYQITGYTFNGYLNMCRSKKAVELLDRGYNATTVSDLCGYNDFSTFYRNFKKFIGVSPIEYKKRKN